MPFLLLRLQNVGSLSQFSCGYGVFVTRIFWQLIHLKLCFFSTHAPKAAKAMSDEASGKSGDGMIEDSLVSPSLHDTFLVRRKSLLSLLRMCPANCMFDCKQFLLVSDDVTSRMSPNSASNRAAELALHASRF